MKLLIKFLLLTSLIVASGCGSNDAKTVIGEPVISVIATKVVRDDIVSFINTTGTIFPKQESMISPKTSGRIEKLYVDEGDRVEKGQPLVALEQERLLIVIKETEASLKETRAQLKNMESTVKRNQKLFEQGVVDSQWFDNAIRREIWPKQGSSVQRQPSSGYNRISKIPLLLHPLTDL